MKELIAVGDRAPEFELKGSDGQSHSLHDVLAESHVLLIFYPGNNTPG